MKRTCSVWTSYTSTPDRCLHVTRFFLLGDLIPLGFPSLLKESTKEEEEEENDEEEGEEKDK